jgi:hypothetical protein
MHDIAPEPTARLLPESAKPVQHEVAADETGADDDDDDDDDEHVDVDVDVAFRPFLSVLGFYSMLHLRKRLLN